MNVSDFDYYQETLNLWNSLLEFRIKIVNIFKIFVKNVPNWLLKK